MFDGTKSIEELRDDNSDWISENRKIINDQNVVETVQIYKIKLKNNVKIWQLFHERQEIINARWPSAQWTDDSIFNDDNWGKGFISGGRSPHFNGHLFTAENNGINLYTFVEKVQNNINQHFTINDSLINLNLNGGINNCTKIVNDNRNDTIGGINTIRLTYDNVPNFDKNIQHSFYLENKLEYLNSVNEWFYDDFDNFLYLRLNNDSVPNTINIRAKVQTYSLDILSPNNFIPCPYRNIANF